MRLRRLEIRRFRKLAGPVLLDGLGDGITVIGGDNEDGKSTVLAALKAALFEHHTVGGAVREAMTPHDGGVPEVQVDFEVGGARYRLHKAFRKGGATLETPRSRLDGDAAEQALIELLRFERRTARESKPRNFGLQGVFWLDQGTSFAGFEALDAGRDRFAAAVEAEAGLLAAGDRGRRLLQSVDAARRAYWTPTWRPAGVLAEAERNVERLAGECAALAQRRQGYDAGIDRLERLRAERRRAIEADELGRARAALASARTALAGVDALEAERIQLRTNVQLCQSGWARLDEQLQRRRDRAAHVADAAEAAARAAADVDAARMRLVLAETAAAAAGDIEQRCVTELTRIERACEEAARRHRLVELDARLGRLRADRKLAAEAADAVARLEGLLAADAATPERVAAVAEAQAALREAQAALQAVATRLDFVPDKGASVTVAGRPHDPLQPLPVTERTELDLSGFGRLVVAPGAGDVDKRRTSLRRAQEKLAAALGAVGVGEPDGLPVAVDRRWTVERQLVEAKALLAALLASHAADNIAVLSHRLGQEEAERATLAERLVPAGEAGVVDPEQLETLRSEARTARAQAGEEQQHAAAQAAARRIEVARSEARSQELAEQAGSTRRALAEETALCPDEQLQVELATAAGARDEAQLRLGAVERRLSAADPDFARDRLAQARRRVEAAEGEATRLERDIRDVEVELRASEAQALGERLAEAEGELALAKAEAERLAVTAGAWKLLHMELSAELAASRDALLTPLRERLLPYLQRLFPQAQPLLDTETLALDRLRRGQAEERFQQLSLGTREQLAILVRLALAKLLQDKEGQSPCLVLDDALVYADEARLEVMKTILQQAARDQQILILTCRPRDYRGLEGRFLRLEDCHG